MARPPALAIAVPVYFGPDGGWTRNGAGAGAVPAIAVVNPNSGPGEASNPRYTEAIRRAQRRGVRMLGYVHTSYGRRPMADVLTEAESYLDWYGVDGIFLDEAGSDADAQPYYAALTRALKQRDPALLSVLNPGTQPAESYIEAADCLVTFEGSGESYQQEAAPPAWQRRYAPIRFWHIVYAVPDAAKMRRMLALARQRRAGLIYVTDGVLPNPYGRLPAYWEDELAEARR